MHCDPSPRAECGYPAGADDAARGDGSGHEQVRQPSLPELGTQVPEQHHGLPHSHSCRGRR